MVSSSASLSSSSSHHLHLTLKIFFLVRFWLLIFFLLLFFCRIWYRRLGTMERMDALLDKLSGWHPESLSFLWFTTAEVWREILRGMYASMTILQVYVCVSVYDSLTRHDYLLKILWHIHKLANWLTDCHAMTKVKLKRHLRNGR